MSIFDLTEVEKLEKRAKKLAKKRIVLYEDGTLIINELTENARKDVQVCREWEPLKENGNWEPKCKTFKFPQWASYRVKRVIIGSTIKPTSLSGWFAYTSVSSLDLSKLDLSNVEDMSSMFEGCISQSLDLRGLDTSKVKNMHKMFAKSNIQTLDLRELNVSNVEDMSSMFWDCRVQSLDLSSFNTSNVTDMCCMFSSCSLQSLDLSSFNTSNVTNMSGMFCGCSVQSLDLSSFNTSNVTDMSHMFSGCYVQSLDLSSFNTSNVTDMGRMFSYCHVQSLDLSSFNINLLRLDYMFQGAVIDVLDMQGIEYADSYLRGLAYVESMYFLSNTVNYARIRKKFPKAHVI